MLNTYSRPSVISLSIFSFLILSSCGYGVSSRIMGEGASSGMLLSSTSGPVGTLLTITSNDGTDLSTVTGITIGGVSEVIVSQSSTTLTILVMPGTTGGSIVLTTPSGSVSYGSTTFSVTTPSYTSYSQLGNKLVGTGNVGNARQAYSLALSADGNTALMGGDQDNTNQGAVWVWTRSGTTWTQQTKLVGTGNVGAANQGYSVAISADGNTALVGGNSDNGGVGAAWVFTRSGTTWTQQGSKLVGTGNVGASAQGWCVALSADGNTAFVGGTGDNTFQGATWVFVRSGTNWSQQGSKLVGTGGTATARQGYFASLSADGNTALVGGATDNASQGAAWVFTRSGTTWSQQGSKLVGTGNIGAAGQGWGVALSADGNTAALGGRNDNTNVGAVWVFTRSGTTWTEETKLVATGSAAFSAVGNTVSLSADGNTLVTGGFGDNVSVGAVWVFTRSGNTWTQVGNKLVGTGNVSSSRQGFATAISADASIFLESGYQDNTNTGQPGCLCLNSTIQAPGPTPKTGTQF